jgi:hypothetical protein
VTASGTTSWSLAFPASNFPSDGTYTVRGYAVDAAGPRRLRRSRPGRPTRG